MTRAPSRSKNAWALPVDRLRLVYGLALIAAPSRLLRQLRAPTARRDVWTLRVLGYRHVVQACALAHLPPRPARQLGAAVDALHVATDAAAAAGSARWRTAAAFDAAMGTAIALASASRVL